MNKIKEHDGEGLFRNCTNLTTVSLPDSLEYIAWGMFEGCEKLQSINLPTGLKEIEGQAFCGCKSLLSISIPEGQYKLGSHTFSDCKSLQSIIISQNMRFISFRDFDGCTNLEEIEIDENNEYYCSIDGVVFSKDLRKLVRYPEGKKDSLYIIPNGVKELADYSFYDVQNLTAVQMPASLEYIGIFSFRGCNKLQKIRTESLTPIDFRSYWQDGVFDYPTPYGSVYNYTLEVPEGTKYVYENHEDWGKFWNIVEFSPSTLSPIECSKLKVFLSGNTIIIKGAETVNHIEFYNLSGSYLGSEQVINGQVSFESVENLVIAKIGEKSIKVKK